MEKQTTKTFSDGTFIQLGRFFCNFLRGSFSRLNARGGNSSGNLFYSVAKKLCSAIFISALSWRQIMQALSGLKSLVIFQVVNISKGSFLTGSIIKHSGMTIV